MYLSKYTFFLAFPSSRNKCHENGDYLDCIESLSFSKIYVHFMLVSKSVWQMFMDNTFVNLPCFIDVYCLSHWCLWCCWSGLLGWSAGTTLLPLCIVHSTSTTRLFIFKVSQITYVSWTHQCTNMLMYSWNKRETHSTPFIYVHLPSFHLISKVTFYC